MRIIGLDIHRVFAEAVALDDGKYTRLGRVGMTRDQLGTATNRLYAWRPLGMPGACGDWAE